MPQELDRLVQEGQCHVSCVVATLAPAETSCFGRWINPKLSIEAIHRSCEWLQQQQSPINPLQQQPLRTCGVSGILCSVKVPLEPLAQQMLHAAPEGQIAVLDDPHRPKLPLQTLGNQMVDIPTGLEAQNQMNR